RLTGSIGCRQPDCHCIRGRCLPIAGVSSVVRAVWSWRRWGAAWLLLVVAVVERTGWTGIGAADTPGAVMRMYVTALASTGFHTSMAESLLQPRTWKAGPSNPMKRPVRLLKFH